MGLWTLWVMIFFAKNNILSINKGAFDKYKSEKMEEKKLYTLIKKTILGGAIKVESSHEESSTSVKVVKIEESNKMIKTSFLAKSTH